MDLNMKLQINSHKKKSDQHRLDDKLLIINFDLNIKGSRNGYLYGIINTNNNIDTNQYEHVWQINQFLTSGQIEKMFGLKSNKLPKPSLPHIGDGDKNDKLKRFFMENEWDNCLHLGKRGFCSLLRNYDVKLGPSILIWKELKRILPNNTDRQITQKNDC